MDSKKKDDFIAMPLKHSEIVLEDGSPNEEKLAILRDDLKARENAKNCVFIVPENEKDFSNNEEASSFIADFVHVARRIKDCDNVVGFAIADEILQKDKGSLFCEDSICSWFIEEMRKKHPHYKYFIKKETAKTLGLDENEIKKRFVLY